MKIRVNYKKYKLVSASCVYCIDITTFRDKDTYSTEIWTKDLFFIKKKIMMYINDMLDDAIAKKLGVSTDKYIEKIEKTTFKRAELIIHAVMSEEKDKIEKAKRIFNLI